MMKNIAIAVLVLGLVALGVAYVTKPSVIAGGNAGPTFVDTIDARNGITIGGMVFSTSTIATASTFPASALKYGIWEVTPNGASLTVTLPATSTIGQAYLPNIGDSKTILVRNASSSPASVRLIIAGGTGTTLKRTSTSTPAEILSDTDQANYATLTFIRRAAGYIDVLFTPSAD